VKERGYAQGASLPLTARCGNNISWMRSHRASHLMLWLACFARIGVRGAATIPVCAAEGGFPCTWNGCTFDLVLQQNRACPAAEPCHMLTRNGNCDASAYADGNLRLGKNNIEAIAWGVFSSPMPGLQKLLLQNNLLSRVEASTFAGLSGCELLNLGNNSITDLETQVKIY